MNATGQGFALFVTENHHSLGGGVADSNSNVDCQSHTQLVTYNTSEVGRYGLGVTQK